MRPSLLALLCCSLLAAAEPDLSINSLGNTYGIGAVSTPQAGKWVQGDMTGACVLPDGTVATVAIWDEFGRCGGLYRDGDVIGNLGRMSRSGGGYAVSTDGVRVYANEVAGELNGSLGAFLPNGARHPTLKFQAGGRVTALAARDGVLVANVDQAGAIRFFDTEKGGAPVRELQLAAAGAIALLPGGDLCAVVGIKRGRYDDNYWVAIPGREPAIVRLDKAGKEVWRIPARPGWLPASLTLDPKGRLVVADTGRSQQVLFYDIAGTPKLAERFGVEGGIGAGRPGEAKPDKFWGLQHAGYDAAGNLYVVMSEDGCCLRSFDTQRKLRWEVHGLLFVDNIDTDPESDGRIVYSVNEKFEVDPTAIAGKGWKLTAITVDHAGRADPRRWRGNSSWASTTMRRIEGRLLQYVTGMYGQQSVFTLPGGKDGELAVFDRRFDDIGRAADLAPDGTWWRAQGGELSVLELRCLSPSGRTAYEPWRRIGVLPGMEVVSDLAYDATTDTVVVHGKAGGKPVIAAFGEARSGRLALRWSVEDVLGPVPYNVEQKNLVCSIAAEHGLVFVGGVATRCRVWVRDGATGAIIREMTPELAEGGADTGGINGTGWMDIPRAVRPFRRANGEWLVYVEDDLSMRVLQFRWRPTGVKPEGLRVVTSSLPRPARGKAYGPVKLLADGAVGAVRWSQQGVLPAGLKLSAEGVLAGTPSADASGDSVIIVTAAAGQQTAARQLTLRVAPHAALVAPATASLAGVAGFPQRLLINATGGTGWVQWTGTLPAGLTVDTATDGRSAVVAGVPAAATTSMVVLSASDEDGQKAEVRLSLAVTAKPLVGEAVAGTPFGSALCWKPDSAFDKAFDGNPGTFFDCTQSPGAECGLSFAQPQPLAELRLFPRMRFLARLAGVQVEVQPQGSEEWIVLHRFTDVLPDGAEDWLTVPVGDARPMGKARLRIPGPGMLNIAEFAAFGRR